MFSSTGVYAASKMSQEILSETLRLEMAPFGVTVLAVTTGAVKTNGQTYSKDWKLPADSIYKPIEDMIAARSSPVGIVSLLTTLPDDRTRCKVLNRYAPFTHWPVESTPFH